MDGNEGMEKKMEITIMDYIRTTIFIHSFIPSLPKISQGVGSKGGMKVGLGFRAYHLSPLKPQAPNPKP